jgi:hypothetical protein
LNPQYKEQLDAAAHTVLYRMMEGCDGMPTTVINLYYLKINSISGNGSITIGEAAHNSHTANNKSQGINSSFGDTSPTESVMENFLNDPDVNDQTSIGSSATSNVNTPPIVPPPILD